MKKKVLITGINGFTGKYVESQLKNNFDVFGLTQTETLKNNCFKADLQNVKLLRDLIEQIKPDFIIHLAAIAFIGHGDLNEFYKVNLIGTRNLLQAAFDSGLHFESIMIASSANVYVSVNEGLLTEKSVTLPANDYAVSKLAMEHMARLWMDKLPIFIVRPFNYTGIGQSSDFLIPKIIHHFKEKAPAIELGNIDVWRDFSDVRTVAKYYQLLIAKKPIGKTINICSGKLYSLREVINMAQDLTGHRIEIKVNPLFVREHEVSKLYGDNTLLNQIVGDVEVPDLKETLAWMLDVETSQ